MKTGITNKIFEAVMKLGRCEFDTLGGLVTVTREPSHPAVTAIFVNIFVFKSGERRHSISANPRHTDRSRFAAHLEGFVEFTCKGVKPAGRKLENITAVGPKGGHLVSGNVTLVIDEMETTPVGRNVSEYSKREWYADEAEYHQEIEVYVDGVHLLGAWLDRRPTKSTLKNPPVAHVGYCGTGNSLTGEWSEEYLGENKHSGLGKLITLARRMTYTTGSGWCC